MQIERLLLFLLPVFLLLLAESFWPKRMRELARWQRWPGALLLLIMGTALIRLVVPAGVIAGATWAESAGFGLFNQVDVPVWIVALAAFAVLDFGVWLQHILLHKVPVLWRFHRVHHTDVDLDVTTALRFHPGEMLFSFVWKISIAILIGAPPMIVFVFEVALNAFAMFNHANLALPSTVDKWLRLAVVTPDMHRVHHSTDPQESQRNFGFCLPWWDRLFDVYQDQPSVGHKQMRLGQPELRLASDQSLIALLRQPFVREAGSVELRRQEKI